MQLVWGHPMINTLLLPCPYCLSIYYHPYSSKRSVIKFSPAPELTFPRGSKKQSDYVKRQITWPYLPILSTLGACKHSIHSYTTIYRSREKDGEGVPLDSHDFTSHRKDGGSRGVTSVPLNSIVFCPLYHRFSLIIHPSHIIALFNHRSYTYIIPVFLRLLYRYHSSISTASL